MTRIVQTFTDFGNRKWRDRLEGGKADNKSPEDFDSDDISIGTAVEREHTSNPDIATEIAMDHLAENPEYYDQLISSGIADEEDAIDLYNKLKRDSDKNKAKEDVIDFIKNSNNEEDDDDYYNDYEEDDLGSDKINYDENDEMIFDEEDEPKNKKNIMEKSSLLKNYNSFINETAEPEKTIEPDPQERRYSRENKYKFQLPYDKKVVNKLLEYNFTAFVPDGGKEISTPKKDTHFIIIDVLNLNFSIKDDESPDIKFIDPSRLKNIIENL